MLFLLFALDIAPPLPPSLKAAHIVPGQLAPLFDFFRLGAGEEGESHPVVTSGGKLCVGLRVLRLNCERCGSQALQRRAVGIPRTFTSLGGTLFMSELGSSAPRPDDTYLVIYIVYACLRWGKRRQGRGHVLNDGAVVVREGVGGGGGEGRLRREGGNLYTFFSTLARDFCRARLTRLASCVYVCVRECVCEGVCVFQSCTTASWKNWGRGLGGGNGIKGEGEVVGVGVGLIYQHPTYRLRPDNLSLSACVPPPFYIYISRYMYVSSWYGLCVYFSC